MTPIILTLGEHYNDSVVLDNALRQTHPEAYRRLEGHPAGVLLHRVTGKDDGTLILRVEKCASESLKINVETGYFVGLLWVVPGVLALRVTPKVDRDHAVVDLLGMLRAALLDDDNAAHLDGLLDMDFREPPIPVESDDQGLRLFLATQFLSLMERILRVGLMRGFHTEEEVFKGKIKGRILLSRTLMRPNVLANRAQGSAALLSGVECRHQVFDFDTTENRLLKAGLTRTLALLTALSKGPMKAELAELAQRAQRFLRAMTEVSDQDDRALPVTPGEAARALRPGHPLYGTYRAALETAELLRKLDGIGVARTNLLRTTLALPPFTVNMPKLFELYVFARLREAMGSTGRVMYHAKHHYQELDYLCQGVPSKNGTDGENSADGASSAKPFDFFVADAKYKPRYATDGITMDDARQLAGYARLESVLGTLEKWGRSDAAGLLPCVVLYPVADVNTPPGPIDWKELEAIKAWRDCWKIGVPLPMTRLPAEHLRQ